jgi:hypothetical protein
MGSSSKDRDTVSEMEQSGVLEDDSSTRQNMTARRHLSDCLMISAIVVVDNGEDLGPLLKKVRSPCFISVGLKQNVFCHPSY